MLSGDGRAFGVIWDRHHVRIVRHLSAMGSSAGDVEDLSAAVFLELWRRRDDVRMVEGSVAPWLIVTAQNVHRNGARSRRRYQHFLASLPPPENSADHAELIAEQNNARVARLRTAIRACSPVDAALLALTALEGFTAAEAAAALDLSEGAAKMRISRLRRRLRSTLAAHPVPEGG